MIRSSRFGSIRSDIRPIQTCFRLGSRIFFLNLATSYKSPAHSSTGTRSDSSSSHCLSAYDFMFFFTPLLGFSFTFPSLYFFTIGHSGVFSLTRWSSLIHTGFHVPHATRDIQKKRRSFWLLDFHHLWCRIQLLRLILFLFFILTPTTPLSCAFAWQWFRLFPFRSPLLRESLLLSFPLATEMFQFTRLPLPFLWIQKGVLLEVALFGNLRIYACSQLPEAYRRPLRPSSSLSA